MDYNQHHRHQADGLLSVHRRINALHTLHRSNRPDVSSGLNRTNSSFSSALSSSHSSSLSSTSSSSNRSTCSSSSSSTLSSSNSSTFSSSLSSTFSSSLNSPLSSPLSSSLNSTCISNGSSNTVNTVNSSRRPNKPANLSSKRNSLSRSLSRLTTPNGFIHSLSIHLVHLLILLFMLANHGSQAQNLTLVTSALRTFQTHACDGQLLHLNCKPNTVISILFAQYGFANNQICPGNSTATNEDKPRNCTESLRYSLLKKVESTCREKSSCSIDSSTRTLGVADQCPNTAKYAEVAYRCRPDTFQNKFACAEKSLDLSCPSRQRILIYAAWFGTAVRTPPECANNSIPGHLLNSHPPAASRKPFKEYCQAKQVTRAVADRCHTQGNCSVRAAFDQFQFPDCVNELTNDERQTEVHLKVTFACVQNEVLRTNLIAGSNTSNNLPNTITNTFGKARPTRPKEATSSFNELTTASSPAQSPPPANGKPEFTDLLDNNLLPASEFNGNNNKLFDQETVHSTDGIDNLPAAVRSNEQQASWPNQLGELPTDFKTHISNPTQTKSIEPFRDWSSFCQYIENNLERLLIYLLVALCVALLFCFVFLGLSHLSERKNKNNQQQCASLECSVQEDCCDSMKPDLSSSVNLNKASQGLSVFADFENDNPTVDEIIADHRNGSYIGISQQLTNQLNAQLAQHCKLPNQMLLSASAITDSSGASLLNCHQLNNQINNQLNNQLSNQLNNQVNNRFASTFSPTHHYNNGYNGLSDYGSEKYDFFPNAMYSNDAGGSPQKITSVPQSASFYNMQTYTPIYTSPANQTIVGATYQQQSAAPPTGVQPQQTQTTFQQLQPAQLLISSQSDNENGSTTTTMTTIGSQTDSSSSSTEMAGNSANGLLHGNPMHAALHHNPVHNSVHNHHQVNSISPSNFTNPVTLQILTTPQHLNDVQLTEATVFQPL